MTDDAMQIAIRIDRSDDINRRPGLWMPVHRYGHLTAAISCPNCGSCASLPPGTQVDAYGHVLASVLCGNAACGLDATVALSSWDFGAINTMLS